MITLDHVVAPSDLPMEATSDGLTYGQDVFFLGFPYDLLGKYIFGPEGYPMPFVKKATVSLFDGAVFLLDGHGNPGFSGGPVVFARPHETKYRVAAVISAGHAVRKPVFEGEKKTPLTYDYSTGIIVSHNIGAALQLIKENPVGCDLSGAP